MLFSESVVAVTGYFGQTKKYIQYTDQKKKKEDVH